MLCTRRHAATASLCTLALSTGGLVAQGVPGSAAGAVLEEQREDTGQPGSSLRPLTAPGRTFYVDADDGDDANEGTTTTTPMRTLAEAARRLAKAGGDKLVLRGRFAEPLALNGINDPTATAPDPNAPTVIQCDFDAEGKPIPAFIDGGLRGAAMFPFDRANRAAGFGPGTGNYLDRGVSISNSNYVTLSGVHVRGIVGTGLLTWQSSHVEIEHCSVAWTTNSAMMLSRGQTPGGYEQDIRVHHCRINQSNLGAWVDRSSRTGFNQKTEAVSFVGIDGFEFAHCVLTNSLMEGVDAKFDARDGRIHHNVIRNTRTAGIYVNEAQDVDVYRNLVQQVGYYDPQNGSGLQNAKQYAEQVVPGTTFSESGAISILISNGDLGGAQVESGRVSGIRVYENVVCWARRGGISVWNQWDERGLSGWVVDDIHIFNNVLYGVAQEPKIAFAGLYAHVTMTNGSISNNIIANSNQKAIDIWNSSAGNFFATNEITNNLLWGNRAGGITGSNAVQASPRFLLPPKQIGGSGTFILRPGSPAIDSGTFMTGINSPGSVPEIGAFQYGQPRWFPGPAR